MDTIRVDIAYRPLRIGWVVEPGDLEAFRRAVRLSYALWGGRYNPILFADNEAESRSLIEAFRVDMLYSIGEGARTKAFPEIFPHLINPYFSDSLYVDGSGRKHAQILDVENAIAYVYDRPEWQRVKHKVQLHAWQPEDPLADVFLAQLGAYPSVEETSIDYRAILKHATNAPEHALAADAAIPPGLAEHLGIPFVSRVGLERHYSIDARRDMPGFFVGEASDVADLVAFWNLRAADIRTWFVDPQHFA